MCKGFKMRHVPFLLKPAAKDYLWGGTRLNDDFGKKLTVSPLAETWECSTHPDGLSLAMIPNGVTSDAVFLKDILNRNPKFLGTHSLSLTKGILELPILIKLIDADQNLSIQVHPDDEYAWKNEKSLGKTEMWYVLAAHKDSELIIGFNQDVTSDVIRNAVSLGNIEDYLNHVPVKKDDLFLIEAGKVHSIGKGILLAEIQENSNLTYRLYDYDRLDKQGRKRELHVEKALDVVCMNSSKAPRQPMRLLKYKKGFATELLCRCKYFQVERMLLNTEINREMIDYRTASNSFHAFLCTEGCGMIFGDNYMLPFFMGDCIFVPAESEKLKLHGKAQLLDVSC